MESDLTWNSIIVEIINAPEFTRAFTELGVEGSLGNELTVEKVGGLLRASAFHRKAIVKDAEDIENAYESLADKDDVTTKDLQRVRKEVLEVLHALAAIYFVQGAANGFHTAMLKGVLKATRVN